jgi:hypothetical protein
MSFIIAILVGVWLLKAGVNVCLGFIQFFVGMLAAIIGAAICTMIYSINGFAWLWRAAFPSDDQDFFGK